MTTITVQTHRPVVAPRGAAIAATVVARVMAWLEAVGRARAAAAVRRRETTRATEAAELRRYVQEWASFDPRFAAEMLAAADRRERTE